MLSALKKERDELQLEYRKILDEYEAYREDAEGRIQEYKIDLRQKKDEIQRYHHLIKDKNIDIKTLSNSQESSKSKAVTEKGKTDNKAFAYEEQIKYLEEKLSKQTKEKEKLV